MKKIIGILLVLVCLFSIYSIAEEECEHEWININIKITENEIIYCYNCNECGEYKEEIFKNDCNHKWKIEYEYCTEDNKYIDYYCIKCNVIKSECTKNTCEHNWSLDEKQYKDNKILYIYNCINCNAHKNEEKENTCKHTWKTKYIKMNEDDIICISYKCTKCNCITTDENPIFEKENMCDHDWLLSYKESYEHNTWEEYKCSICNASKSIDKYNNCEHEFIKKKEKYLSDEGYIEINYKCNKCQYSMYKYIESKCKHNWTLIEKTEYAPSEYVKEVYKIYKCNKCDYKKQEWNLEENKCNHIYYHDRCTICGCENSKHTHDYEKVNDSIVWKTREVVTTYKCFCGDHYTERRPYSEYQQEEAASNSKEFVAPITGKPKLWVEFDDSDCKTTHNCDCSNIEHEHDWELMYEEEDDNGNVVHIHYECTFTK